MSTHPSPHKLKYKHLKRRCQMFKKFPRLKKHKVLTFQALKRMKIENARTSDSCATRNAWGRREDNSVLTAINSIRDKSWKTENFSSKLFFPYILFEIKLKGSFNQRVFLDDKKSNYISTKNNGTKHVWVTSILPKEYVLFRSPKIIKCKFNLIDLSKTAI